MAILPKMRTITHCTTISRENEDNIQFLAIAIRNFHSATNNETTVREDYITILEQYNTFQQYTIGLIEAMYDIHRKEQGYPSLHLFKNPQPQPLTQSYSSKDKVARSNEPNEVREIEADELSTAPHYPSIKYRFKPVEQPVEKLAEEQLKPIEMPLETITEEKDVPTPVSPVQEEVVEKVKEIEPRKSERKRSAPVRYEDEPVLFVSPKKCRVI